MVLRGGGEGGWQNSGLEGRVGKALKTKKWKNEKKKSIKKKKITKK